MTLTTADREHSVLPLDLTREVPRSPFEEIDGLAWLPRLADKTRAYYAGMHGAYTPYPAPGDQNFLSFFGLDAAELGEAIKAGATDAELGAFVKARTRRSPADAAAFRDSLLNPPTNRLIRLVLAVLKWKRSRALQALRPELNLAAVDSFSKLFAFEEGHPVPGA